MADSNLKNLFWFPTPSHETMCLHNLLSWCVYIHFLSTIVSPFPLKYELFYFQQASWEDFLSLHPLTLLTDQKCENLANEMTLRWELDPFLSNDYFCISAWCFLTEPWTDLPVKCTLPTPYRVNRRLQAKTQGKVQKLSREMCWVWTRY